MLNSPGKSKLKRHAWNMRKLQTLSRPKCSMAYMLLRFLVLNVPITGLGFATENDVAKDADELAAANKLQTACMMWICFQ